MELEWVDICEDVPLHDKKYIRLSLPIDILTEDGKIYYGGFMTIDEEEFYDECSNKIRNVKAWRSV